jgi:hypothetical protein
MLGQLKYRENLTAEIVNMNTKIDGFKQNLSLEESSNELAVGCVCKCKGACAKTLVVHVNHKDPSVQLFVTVEEDLTSVHL